jgi:ribonucleoside-diphosphate reductase beta chain
MSQLTTEQAGYKPFRFPQAYEFWKRQQQTHWMPDEVPLGADVKDYLGKLSPAEVNLLTQIFRFFTQADIEVNDCYHRHYLSTFKPTEIVMMLTAFANMETVHIAAYSHLLETLGMPETEYSAFLEYAEMKDKSDYLKKFNTDTPYDVALTMAAFGAFTEGLQLFASFAILLNFPRFGLMKGMGQIITWSVRDESLHCEGILWLYRQWLNDHPEIDRARLKSDIIKIGREVVTHEDRFIDLAFSMGPVRGTSAQEIKNYIRYIANLRSRQLGFDDLYPGFERNPLPWLEELLNGVEHANFFEQRATEYTRAGATGSWGDVWDTVDTTKN